MTFRARFRTRNPIGRSMLFCKAEEVDGLRVIDAMVEFPNDTALYRAIRAANVPPEIIEAEYAGGSYEITSGELRTLGFEIPAVH